MRHVLWHLTVGARGAIDLTPRPRVPFAPNRRTVRRATPRRTSRTTRAGRAGGLAVDRVAPPTIRSGGRSRLLVHGVVAAPDGDIGAGEPPRETWDLHL